MGGWNSTPGQEALSVSTDVLCVLFLYVTLKAQTQCDAIKTWKMILS